jgi:DNA-binding NarL/FixJ family response regulator
MNGPTDPEQQKAGMSITVAIIEDNPEFLSRFVEVIQSQDDLSFAGAAVNGVDGMELINNGPADVYLIDLGLPDISGMELIRHAATVHPDCAVMVITVFGDDAHVIASIEAGATGYLLKDSPAPEIAGCIRMLHEGGSPMSPVIARRILQRFRVQKAAPATPAPKPPPKQAPTQAAAAGDALTEREVGILRALAKGLTYKEIGGVQSISSHTVAQHVKNIYRKLTVHSRGEAVYEATKRGLINL